ncbi:hypothetical protein HOB91_01875 [Candidatus Woesearchaeota archaeon]|jgi:hypothetical protein|nr:hypothetical protein [Candidatus Woesearchaeota archaeon]MBT6402579.1 hypothetical protein [Candidatus Woesearchaeota archaeon]
MENKVHSVFGVEGYGGEEVASMTPKLEELVNNDFDLEKFRISLQAHQLQESDMRKEMIHSVGSIEKFNDVIHRVKERSNGLKPLNKELVRALKYGHSKIFGIFNIGGLLTKSLRGHRTEDLVSKYCGFFDEQAEDFGQLFYHVVEREGKLTDYSNELVRKNQFYLGTQETLDTEIGRLSEEKNSVSKIVVDSTEITAIARKAIVDRAKMKYDGSVESRRMLDTLVSENERAIEETGGLIGWSCGMKNVLALGKERMDNYCRHLEETMVAYLQAISMNNCFRDTNNAVRGMANVMIAAQASADSGVSNIVEFIKHNGLYGKPLNFRSSL